MYLERGESAFKGSQRCNRSAAVVEYANCVGALNFALSLLRMGHLHLIPFSLSFYIYIYIYVCPLVLCFSCQFFLFIFLLIAKIFPIFTATPALFGWSLMTNSISFLYETSEPQTTPTFFVTAQSEENSWDDSCAEAHAHCSYRCAADSEAKLNIYLLFIFISYLLSKLNTLGDRKCDNEEHKTREEQRKDEYVKPAIIFITASVA